MRHRKLALRLTVASALLSTALATPSTAGVTTTTGFGTFGPAGGPQHQHTVETTKLRGATFQCHGLRLRVRRGTETEITDADLRGGVARISTSRTWRGVRLRGSDGRRYRATGATIAWFVLREPDFETPEHGLEVVQVVFRGGAEKSPGWLRERISWKDKQERDVVRGPCEFGT